MTARPAGDAALLVEAGEQAAELAEAITARRFAGVLDVIPGAQTVLVTVQPGSWDLGELASRILVLPPAVAPASSAALAEIPVHYDGPDLAEVAQLAGLPVSAVVARHEAADYRVGWLGFSPGFGYLTGLDPVLAAVPRLASPRLSVPAGSVAIAGGLAAVYPASSPGGWRLLGRTDTRLWDPLRDPPALLAPGMRVRFRAVPPPASPAPPGAESRHDPGASGSHIDPDAPGSWTDVIEILQPGPLATIQDLGRPGFGHLGVPRSGAADMASLMHANELVGNPVDAAGLEITLGRAALRFRRDTAVALAGAPAPLALTETLAGAAWQPDHATPFSAAAGSVLRLAAPAAGLRSYLAVRGGIQSASVLGSQSADLLSGLGPRPLRAGDLLAVGSPGASGASGAAGNAGASGASGAAGASGASGATGEGGAIGASGRVPARGPGSRDAVELRVVAGPRDDWFEPAALAVLTSGTFEVTPASNRTGLRLAGPPLRRARAGELPSEGMVTGALQVPGDGQPILLLADHPATGGYPVLAVVATADIGPAAQLRPGQRVRFVLSG